MAEGRTKKSVQNIITGLFLKFIGIFCPFIIRTIMIKKLGADYLGLNQLFTSILQILSLSELGIGNAMVYSMYKPMAENDTDKICALLALYKKIYRIIGLVTLVIGLILMPFIDKFISGSYPSGINIYILYLIFLSNTVVSYFLFAYKKSILDAQQKVSVDNAIHSVISIVMYALQIVALLITANYYVYIIILPLSTVALNLIRGYIIKRKYPQYVCRGKIDKNTVDTIFTKVKALIGNKIGSAVLWFSDSIVISSFLGLHSLAVYSNYYYIMNAIIGLFAIVYNSILASVGNSIVMESTEKNHKDFLSLTLGNSWAVGWCAVCLLCLYQPFMKLWMGEKLMLSTPMVILFVMYFYFWLFNKIGNTYVNAAGLWNKLFWKPYVSAGVNLILNIVLVIKIGLAGVLISTIIASVFVDTIWEAYVLYKYLFKTTGKKYVFRLVFDVIIVFIVSAITYFLCSFITLTGFVGILIKGIVATVISNILFFMLYFKTNEFKLLKNKASSIIKRKV